MQLKPHFYLRMITVDMRQCHQSASIVISFYWSLYRVSPYRTWAMRPVVETKATLFRQRKAPRSRKSGAITPRCLLTTFLLGPSRLPCVSFTTRYVVMATKSFKAEDMLWQFLVNLGESVSQNWHLTSFCFLALILLNVCLMTGIGRAWSHVREIVGSNPWSSQLKTYNIDACRFLARCLALLG